jgi:hypothetical protein
VGLYTHKYIHNNFSLIHKSLFTFLRLSRVKNCKCRQNSKLDTSRHSSQEASYNFDEEDEVGCDEDEAEEV